MKWITAATMSILAVSACMTIFFVKTLKPASTGAFVFLTVWLLLPYVVMSIVLLWRWRKRAASLHWHGVAALVSIGGMVFLMDVIFWRPDAQGAIAVLMTPMLQGGALAVLLPLVSWLSRDARG
jgi:hypothetical protein